MRHVWLKFELFFYVFFVGFPGFQGLDLGRCCSRSGSLIFWSPSTGVLFPIANVWNCDSCALDGSRQVLLALCLDPWHYLDFLCFFSFCFVNNLWDPLNETITFLVAVFHIHTFFMARENRSHKPNACRIRQFVWNNMWISYQVRVLQIMHAGPLVKRLWGPKHVAYYNS